jgi:hypothetical protein
VIVDLAVTVTGGLAGDEARELWRWLVDADELRGRVRLVEPTAQPGSMGGVADTLAVAVAPGGAASVFAAVLVSWIRHRSGKTRAVVRRPDGAEIEVSAEWVGRLDAPAVRSLIAELTRAVEGEEADDSRNSPGPD